MAKLLVLTIVLPISAIYVSALYGFLRFKDYADSVADTKEGPHLGRIAQGLMVLAFSLPIMALVNSLYSQVKLRSPELVPTTTILRNYLVLILTIIAFFLIARGSKGLLRTLKDKKLMDMPPFISLVGPIAISSVYTWLITSQGPGADSIQGYYLPNWIIIFTLAIPYIFIWCIGLQAALYLSRYKDSVTGKLYVKAFDNFSKGIAVIILISVFGQFLTTLSGPLNRLNLTPLLGVIYFLLALYALGFGLVAYGAKRLKQIEEA